MPYRPFFPPILTRYVCKRFVKLLLLCLFGLTSIYLMVEFFERLDNLMAQGLSYWFMIEYLSLRLPQVIFQILPVAVLMAILLILGGMSKDGELIALLAGGINIFQIIFPLLIICLGLSFLSGLYQESLAPVLTQKTTIRLAEIKGEKIRKKLPEGRIWLAGKQERFFHIRHLDTSNQSITGMTVFEVDDSFRLKKRWDIKSCYFKDGLWHLEEGQIWNFREGTPEVQNISNKRVSWPEEFSDFAGLQKDPAEMRYGELKRYVKRLEAWGYDVSIQKTDLYFKWAFPVTCFIFGLLGIPFAIRLHRGVRYMSLGISLGISFIYWILMYVGVSMAHAGIMPPVVGAWAGSALFGFMGIFMIFNVHT
jgi:lipopolysaccharide export system permease protein